MYEHVARELDVACAVKCLAKERHGVEVEIVHYPCGVVEALDRLRPRLVVMPVCYGAWEFYRPDYHAMYEWRDAIHLNLAWEQLLYPGNRDIKTPKGQFAMRHVLHHSWSRAFADYLRSVGVPDDHIVINGHLAYGLYSEPYRRSFDQREQLAPRFGLDPAKRWVLFAENYGWAFYNETLKETLISRKGMSRESVNELCGFSRESLKHALRWLIDLARSPELEIIIRPRPATLEEEFTVAVHEVAADLPLSVHVIKEGTVREWVLASDVVLSSWSTCLIEAALAGKPAYMIEPLPILPSLDVEWHRHAARIRTTEELVVACARLEPEVSKPLEAWARGSLLSTGDPISNLADMLAGLVHGKTPHPPIPTRESVTERGRFPVPAWMSFEYRRLLHRRKRKEFKVEDTYTLYQQREAVTPEEMERRCARWSAVLANGRAA